MNRAKQEKKNSKREHRIAYEIVVDCYNEEEHATGWHCYLEDSLKFPFQAELRDSLLRKAETVQVVAMSEIELCLHEMFVDIEWSGRTLAVPLDQLKPMKANKKTVEAIEDWYYWKKMGYEF
jgi:hypothetical protein